MYLGWADYAVLALLLLFSFGTGIYQGYIKSKQSSTAEFLVASGRMKILPTAMSLFASLISATFLLGMPVEVYYYGSMFIYCAFSWLIATFLTVKFFIPKFHYIGSASIYAYLEKRFSLAIRILVTLSFITVTILYMAVILYGPSLALSQVTGLNIWFAVGSCGLICTIYTSVGGMKAVIWTDVIQTSAMFLGLILSIILGFVDLGGPAKVFDIVKKGQRLQLTVFSLDPSIRYTIWSILIGSTFSSTTQYACIQTQAQRFMCVKDAQSAQKVAWRNYFMNLMMQMLCLCVGFLLYAKYHQCDPLRANRISRADQLYPLFVTEIFQRFPGFTGLFTSSILSATLSTFSSGVNSMATVVLEDIYKRLAPESAMTNERQVQFSKILSIILGCLTVLFSFLVSFLESSIMTIIIQVFGSFAAPILGIYLLGLFTSRVRTRSAFVAYFVALSFQLFVLAGSMSTIKPANKDGGRLPISIVGCPASFNLTQRSLPSIEPSKHILLSLFSISPLWFIFNGAMITVFVGYLFSFILDSKDSTTIDPFLLVSRDDLFSRRLFTKAINKPIESLNDDDHSKTKPNIDEEEVMI